jgi:hypothetical protein
MNEVPLLPGFLPSLCPPGEPTRWGAKLPRCPIPILRLQGPCHGLIVACVPVGEAFMSLVGADLGMDQGVFEGEAAVKG